MGEFDRVWCGFSACAVPVRLPHRSKLSLPHSFLPSSSFFFQLIFHESFISPLLENPVNLSGRHFSGKFNQFVNLAIKLFFFSFHSCLQEDEIDRRGNVVFTSSYKRVLSEITPFFRKTIYL